MISRILWALTFAIVSVVAVAEAEAAGRWKLDGNGACYWDENDDGPNQCGRLKMDGNGQCYWEWNEGGAHQCTPPSGEQFWSAVAFAEDYIASISGSDIPDGIEALELAYDYGLLDEDPEELWEAHLYGMGVAGYTSISCTDRGRLKAKAEKAGLGAAALSGLLGISSVSVAVFGPPGLGAAGALAIGSTGMAAFSVGFYQLASTIGGMSCT